MLCRAFVFAFLAAQNANGGSTDKWLTRFTGALVIVGFLQVVTLVWQAVVFRKSLKKIGEQATEMHGQRLIMHDQFETMQNQVLEMGKQTRLLERSVSVAEKSADAAAANIQIFKDKERARLRIEVRDLRLELDSPIGRHVVASTIFHDGLTNAINVDGHARAVVSDQLELLPAEGSWPMLLPQVIKTKDDPIQVHTPFYTNLGFKLSPEQVEAINTDKAFMHFFGQIRFEDVFGDRWVLRFRRRWAFSLLTPPPTMPRFGSWFKYGPDSENSETREE